MTAMKQLAIRTTVLLLAALPIPAVAQTVHMNPDQQPRRDREAAPRISPTPGKTAETGSGEVGERQIVGSADPAKKPLARLNQRIQNRVQNRLRNRIDRYYDPKANATSPFAIAEDEQAATLRPPRQ